MGSRNLGLIDYVGKEIGPMGDCRWLLENVNCWNSSNSKEITVWRSVMWTDCKGRSRRERLLDKLTELWLCFTFRLHVDKIQDAQLSGGRESITNMFSKCLAKPQNVKSKLDKEINLHPMESWFGNSFVCVYIGYCHNRILCLPYCVL